jgi:hypothetical protein
MRVQHFIRSEGILASPACPSSFSKVPESTLLVITARTRQLATTTGDKRNRCAVTHLEGLSDRAWWHKGLICGRSRSS